MYLLDVTKLDDIWVNWKSEPIKLHSFKRPGPCASFYTLFA
jgi:hypothetical protein